MTNKVIMDFSDKFLGNTIDPKAVPVNTPARDTLMIALSQTANSDEVDSAGKRLYGIELYKTRMEKLINYVESLNPEFREDAYMPSNVFVKPYKPSISTNTPLKDKLDIDPNDKGKRQWEAISDAIDAFQDMDDRLSVRDKSRKKDYDKFTVSNTSNFSNDYLNAPISKDITESNEGDKQKIYDILNIILSQPATTMEIGKNGKPLIGVDKYKHRLDELVRFIKLTENPRPNAPSAGVPLVASKGRKRMTTKELKQHLQSRKDIPKQTPYNLKQTIFDILKS
jgi:hypothetical protein